ncbi:cation diffusion facilitator family transporter [Aidingimonas halophila]|uniref:Cation diffusion facilitator family transporter n=1 Tax=Aidingimonas halophila TaxID=574349 RepID=A0A1H3ARE7_9GAMM|nr:cation diffusion facilitator family transporter [Aidingimonas halophila]GHC25193.1 cation diffusion facilitator transporter [Aidingimonas halophila]SDX32175.1 cation diffusion facilitator family transporter [Aidingimonas halophila]
MGSFSAHRLSPAHTREAHRVTLVGAIIDAALGIAKVITGIIVGSAALIADGIHSFSDLITDAMVLVATHFGRQAPDHNHPYGHGRIETLATLWLGSVLIFVAGGIAWASLSRLMAGTPIPAPGQWAILLSLIALVLKEWIFHYTLRVAKRVRSRLLEANAWHSRSDALSSIVVLIGLVGAQFGIGWLDGVAAIIVGLLVGKIGWDLLWDAGHELVDTALPVEQQHRMQETVTSVPGVESVHEMRTRTIGGRVLLDMHLVVSPRISVSEAHEVGNQAHRDLHDAFPRLTDVTFHIDPEDDSDVPDIEQRPGLPLRDDVEVALEARWGHLPAWQQRIDLGLHYLDDRIELSLYIPDSLSTNGQSLDGMADELQEAARDLGWLGQLRLWQGNSTY